MTWPGPLKEKLFVQTLCALIFFCIPAFFPVIAQTVTAKIVMGQVYMSSEFVINARVDSVMLRLVHSQTLADLMDYEYQGGAKWLLHVGDAVSLVPQVNKFGQRDTGVIIASYLKTSSELCFTFEPDNGAYIYQDQWKFFPSAGNQTRLVFSERCLDSEGSHSSAKTGERTRQIQQWLARLKSVVERR